MQAHFIGLDKTILYNRKNLGNLIRIPYDARGKSNV